MLREIWHRWLKTADALSNTEVLQERQQVWWSHQGQQTHNANVWVVGNREVILEKDPSFCVVSHFLRDDKEKSFQQFRVSIQSGPLMFKPILSDRSLLIRLKEPLWLLPKCSIQASILSPIWVRISTEDNLVFSEISSQSVRFSWSGANPMQGDICYSSLVEVHFQPVTQWASWQVMTPVVFINEDDKPILVQEVLLPHPFLNLYLKPNGQLGTFSLHCQYQAQELQLKLNVEGGDPHIDQLLGARNDSAHQLKMRHLLAYMQPL